MSKKRRPKKFKATFENGGFWEYYEDLERQFEDFLQYVPYFDINERVCSFRLSNILLSIGGHVDSAFKEMAAYKKFSKNEKCKQICQKVRESKKRIKRGKGPITIKIEDCLSAFETEYRLSRKRVIFKRLPKREFVTPFYPHNPKTNAPEWWGIYNGLKHDFGSNFEKANLRVTLHALASAFLLNVIHFPAILRLNDYRILKCTVGAWIKRKALEDMLERKQKIPGFVETPLFIYDYRQ